ncbi:hypothetical protein [Streptomyces koyangensis]
MSGDAALAMFVLPAQKDFADTPPEGIPELSDGDRALAETMALGSRVEVVGERSERTTVSANPDGFTFTLEQSVVPVRVAKGESGWQAPDAMLERRPDGSVGPKAAAVDMTFSGGGDDALVQLSKQQQSLELAWPTALPTPRPDGPSTVHADVLPDVDLMGRAGPSMAPHGDK